MASFFWIRSMVRDDSRRRLLFDLDMAINNLRDDVPRPAPLSGGAHWRVPQPPPPMGRRMKLPLGLLAVLALPAPAAAQAAAAQSPAPRATIELNKLEARAEGCSVWLLLRNPTQAAHERLRLDLLLFGRDGVVAAAWSSMPVRFPPRKPWPASSTRRACHATTSAARC
jgi:hypothetical protein